MKTINVILIKERKGGAQKSTLKLFNELKRKGISSRVLRLKLGAIGMIPFMDELFLSPIKVKNYLKELDYKKNIFYFNNPLHLLFLNNRMINILSCKILFSRQIRSLNKNLGFFYRIIFNPFLIAIIKILEKQSLKKTKKIIVYKKSLKEYLVKELGIRANNIIIIPQGVFSSKNKTNRDYKKENLVILFIGGKGSLLKNFDGYMNLANRFKEEDNIKFIAIVRKVSKNLFQKSRNCNLEIKVNLNKSQIKNYLKKADIFIMPSLSETGPRVTLEAMSFGLPIIGTREGLGDYCNKKGGLIIKNKDIEDWYNKLFFLIKNPNKRKAMGEYNKKRVKNRFNKKRQINEEIKLLTKYIE